MPGHAFSSSDQMKYAANRILPMEGNDYAEMEERVQLLESNVGAHESDGLRTDIQVIGEALDIVRRVLGDLVDVIDSKHASEYVQDLERLDEISKLTLFSS